MNQPKSAWIRVWDPIVRFGHWTLVAGFFIAYFTEEDFLALHVWAGYVVGAVVLFRLLWGFVGTRHARFSDFVFRPAVIARYLKRLRRGEVEHYVGHNPAGGAMILLLLACVSLTVYTGLEVYAVKNHAGPLAALQGGAEPAAVFQPENVARPGDGYGTGHRRAGEGREDGFWEELHETFANLTLMLVILHVTGAIVSSYLHRENLVKAMITGKKPNTEGAQAQL
jgi:cytochrome b